MNLEWRRTTVLVFLLLLGVLCLIVLGALQNPSLS